MASSCISHAFSGASPPNWIDPERDQGLMKSVTLTDPIRADQGQPRRFQIRPGNTTPREHWVYVIELPDAVGQRETPDREIVYVGMTSRSAKARFEQHLRGHHSARIIKRALRLG